MKQITRCGYIAIIGRPNVGKSTLLNRILGQKISITSHKPQTTRQQLLGIKTEDNVQAIYVDTPGLHRDAKQAINRYMNRAALQALEMVDVIGWVVEAGAWTGEEEWISKKLQKVTQPIILIVNKVDKNKDKTALLPYLQQIGEKNTFAEIIPVSAKTGDNMVALEQTFAKYLPENPYMFPDDQITDRNDRFLASEIIREKLMRNLHQEIPYALTVEIEQFQEKDGILHISAIIWLEKENQKSIVIGKKGEQLKNVGQRARMDMEKLFSQKVFLRLWTKVKEGWSDDERALASLGYK